MNKVLEDAARRAITAPGFEKRDGWCGRWMRQTIQSTPYKKLNLPTLPTARHYFYWFKDHGYAIDPERGHMAGDILFKIAEWQGKAGHVGIRVTGNLVAENSSAHWGEDKDARGFRSVAGFGLVTGVVRLPPLEDFLKSIKGGK